MSGPSVIGFPAGTMRSDSRRRLAVEQREGSRGWPSRARIPSNAEVADQLAAVARILREQGANPFRVGAYENAAKVLRAWSRPLAEVLAAEGLAGLDAIPGIGAGLARAIEAILTTGHLPFLDRLREHSDPVALLMSVPGVGARLAERLHQSLGIDTLEGLEQAAHDGRLAKVPRIGPKRLAAIRDSLATRLRRSRPAPERAPAPPIAEVLEVDAEYRRRVAAGTLPRISPRRFNRPKRRWLPILHTSRAERHYTALYSNTALAHRLGKTSDWVVLYYDGAGTEGQCTVITAERGVLAGRRVVRGREAQCVQHYGLGRRATTES